MTHHVTLQQELTNYRGQNVEADVCGFSLSSFWLLESKPTLAQGTGELVPPPDLPHLALLARLYHGVEATSCQEEHNFSSLSVLIGTLRASISGADDVSDIEPGMPARGSKVQRRQCVQGVQSALKAVAGETVDVEI